MSRAFVKDDAPSEDILVVRRAPLPAGEPNYVTPRGYALLVAERDALRADAARLQGGGAEAGRDAARALARTRGALDELEARIASARVVERDEAPPDTVAFGRTVAIRTVGGARAGETSTFTVVGVDEADPLEGLVAFTAPVARAVAGLAVGERATASIGGEERTLEVVTVTRRDAA